MRDYNLMRNMLVFIDRSDRELNLVDFQHFDSVSPVQGELSRLQQEGLVDSSMAFKPSYNNGTVRGLTEEGAAFLRDIEDDNHSNRPFARRNCLALPELSQRFCTIGRAEITRARRTVKTRAPVSTRPISRI